MTTLPRYGHELTPKQFTSSVYLFRRTDEGSEIALLHHKKLDKWMIPGGHVDENENPSEAAAREVHEELGLEIEFLSSNHHHFGEALSDARETVAPELIVEEFVPDDDEDGDHIHVDFLFFAEAASSDLRINEREARNADWFTPETVPRTQMFESTARLVDQFFGILSEGTYRRVEDGLAQAEFDLY